MIKRKEKKEIQSIIISKNHLQKEKKKEEMVRI